jgi:dTDP-glucose pyrophosphorylase
VSAAAAEKTRGAAILLAAGDVPLEMRPFTGRTCAAMLPVSGRPVVHWLLQYLHEQGVDRVIVGLRDVEVSLPHFLQHSFGSRLAFELVPVSVDVGPGFTLLECLKRLPEGEPVLVVLGDTIFEFPDDSWPEAGCFVLTTHVDDTDRWCLAEVDSDGRVVSLADKPSQNPGGWPALIGVYRLDDASAAIESLEGALARGVEKLEVRHALEPYIRAGRLQAFVAGDWFDCGHPDLLMTSRRRMLQARRFNSIEVDELRSTLTKRSTHRDKLLEEIAYYRRLPADLALFFPRAVDHGSAPDDVFLTLEYYSYPTLSELWVFEEYGPVRWERVFRQLAFILDCFEQHPADLSTESAFDLYWNKTLTRLDEWSHQDPEFAMLLSASELRLDETRLRGWPTLLAELEERVRGLAAGSVGRIIHGDFCLPNILFDPLSGQIKLIDPRGSFGEVGLVGDARYDVAKLLHSIDGGYDLFIHDMFLLKRDGVEIRLQQFFPAGRAQVLEAFERAFGVRFDLDEVRLIQGLLFMSMCPLHDGHAARQVAMFATGLRILNEIL